MECDTRRLVAILGIGLVFAAVLMLGFRRDTQWGHWDLMVTSRPLAESSKPAQQQPQEEGLTPSSSADAAAVGGEDGDAASSLPYQIAAAKSPSAFYSAATAAGVGGADCTCRYRQTSR